MITNGYMAPTIWKRKKNKPSTASLTQICLFIKNHVNFNCAHKVSGALLPNHFFILFAHLKFRFETFTGWSLNNFLIWALISGLTFWSEIMRTLELSNWFVIWILLFLFDRQLKIFWSWKAQKWGSYFFFIPELSECDKNSSA